MSSAVQSLSQVKARFDILWQSLCSAAADVACSFFTMFTLWFYSVNMTWSLGEHQKEGMGTLDLVLHAMHKFSGDDMKTSSTKYTVYSICSAWSLVYYTPAGELTVACRPFRFACAACPCKLQSQNKSWPPTPLQLRSWSRRRSGSTL